MPTKPLYKGGILLYPPRGGALHCAYRLIKKEL